MNNFRLFTRTSFETKKISLSTTSNISSAFCLQPVSVYDAIHCGTPTFSGVPNAKGGEQNQKWVPHPCLLGHQKRAEMLLHPCILRDPQCQARGANQKWLPHPCLLRGPREGGNDTSPVHSRGSPRPSAGNKITSGPRQRRTKSEVAASPLPSTRPKRGRKCCVTPAFSEVPEEGFKKGPQPACGKKPLTGFLDSAG